MCGRQDNLEGRDISLKLRGIRILLGRNLMCMGLTVKEGMRSSDVKEVWDGWNLECVKVQMRRAKRKARSWSRPGHVESRFSPGWYGSVD